MASVHISLNVSELSRSVDFYRRFLGEPVKLKADYAKFVSAEPEIHLALAPGIPSPAGPGALSHMGIRVDSSAEVRRRREELQKRGLLPEEEKREECCYALQDKFWLSDPDGNRWEVYNVIDDVEAASADRQVCCSR